MSQGATEDMKLVVNKRRFHAREVTSMGRNTDRTRRFVTKSEPESSLRALPAVHADGSVQNPSRPAAAGPVAWHSSPGQQRLNHR